jgi:oxysterol-binding protein-related protein 8
MWTSVITEADEYCSDENEGSIITHMVSQLRCVRWYYMGRGGGLTAWTNRRVGMDLSKVSFPTFVLEPRSMLERITDFMAHPDLIFGCVHLFHAGAPFP